MFYNDKIKRDNRKIKSLNDWKVKNINFSHTLPSGEGQVSSVFANEGNVKKPKKLIPKNIEMSKIPPHIIYFALAKNKFYYFDNLKHYFPNINSLSDFIKSSDYLGELEITFQGTEEQISGNPPNISNKEYFRAVERLLSGIETDIKSEYTEYVGTDYKNYPIKEVFKKEIEVKVSNNEKRDVSQYKWYAYDSHYGTREEWNFVKSFDVFINDNKYIENFDLTKTFLIRNERALTIFNETGRGFEPDFILFCSRKSGELLTYQVFIEPKGRQLIEHDKWKECFLKSIQDNNKIFEIHDGKYLVTAVPIFYNTEHENRFIKSFKETLKIKSNEIAK